MLNKVTCKLGTSEDFVMSGYSEVIESFKAPIQFPI